MRESGAAFPGGWTVDLQVRGELAEVLRKTDLLKRDGRADADQHARPVPRSQRD